MKSLNCSLVACILFVSSPTWAAPFEDDMLKRHNTYRAMLPSPPMVRDSRLSDAANDYARAISRGAAGQPEGYAARRGYTHTAHVSVVASRDYTKAESYFAYLVYGKDDYLWWQVANPAHVHFRAAIVSSKGMHYVVVFYGHGE